MKYKKIRSTTNTRRRSKRIAEVKQSPVNTPFFDMEGFDKNVSKQAKRYQNQGRNIDKGKVALKSVTFHYDKEFDGPTLFSQELGYTKPGWKFLHANMFNP